MKFCTNCGAQIPANAANCPNCGTLQPQPQVPLMQQVAQPIMNQPVGMAPMPPMMAPKSNLFRTILIITILGAIASCFLPLLSAGGYTMNFVYYEGEVLDGAFIVVAEVIALICLLCKTKIPVFILQLPACGILISDLPDLSKGISSSFFGIGFYLVIITVVASTILSLLRMIMKNKYE